MKKIISQKTKMNNKGFSLVELLIAMAILAVVSLCVYSFMNTGARLYGKTSSDADIQKEAQLVANTISDLIIDCEVNIRYDNTVSDSIGSGSGGSGGTGGEGGSGGEGGTGGEGGSGGEGESGGTLNTEAVVDGGEAAEGGEGSESGEGSEGGEGVAVDANDEILEISNSDYQFLIIQDDDKLFYLERRANASTGVYDPYDLSQAELLAENVTDFDVDLSRVTGKRRNIVSFSLTYEKMGRKYSGNYQVNLRNSVTVNEVITKPLVKEENISRVIVTPDVVYVDVKRQKNDEGEWIPTSQQKTQVFMASSDAVNVTTQKLFTWSMSESTGTGASFDGDIDGKSCTIRFANDLSDIPASFNVVATSTIANKATSIYPQGTAVVYYKKILDMQIAATRGVIENKAEPGTSAVFTAEISDYNLSTEEKKCKWTLECKKGDSAEYEICRDASVASLRPSGSTAVVTLGNKDDMKYYTFRLTAVSDWDPSWSAQYEFGVATPAKKQGIDEASRGVAIDMTALFTTGFYGPYAEKNLPNLDYIYDVRLQNYSGNDVDTILEFRNEGEGETGKRAYMYLDYNDNRYTEGENMLNFFDTSNIEITIFYVDKDGNKKSKDGVNIQMAVADLNPGKPVGNGVILIPKGGYYDAAFTTNGYNIAKKNQIGIYLSDSSDGTYQNVNSNEYGMQDFSSYISVNYTGSLGNRNLLIQEGSFRITAKADQTVYPEEAIGVKVTLDDMYRILMSSFVSDSKKNECIKYETYDEDKGEYIKDTPYPKTRLQRASYDFDAYVANVEGQNLFVQGPMDGKDWTTTTVVWQEGSEFLKSTQDNLVLGSSYTFSDDGATNNITIKFDKVLASDKQTVSYYKMEYNGDTYYYNSTYNCWKPTS
ncbi:MAG: prepilin-type N-terminal cleavage/methylation domain-containing protein [Lachnospiraceae bacterium]|nr:prepilin-type N-terminal cleavage/methylation domain-containing protein [Lachnospiraceae bacterium]